MDDQDCLLIIFTRNIEFGKCKTRLAKTVGPKIALDIYQFLVRHTADISANLEVNKWVFYSEHTQKGDVFDDQKFLKYVQQGDDLGSRMKNAFELGFSKGYKKIIIIGSDIYDLDRNDLEEAFEFLDKHETVIGPAEDGGYYLLGLKSVKEAIFSDKPWGKATVLEETLRSLESEDLKLLDVRNDVDIYEDIENIPVFQEFLKDWKQ